VKAKFKAAREARVAAKAAKVCSVRLERFLMSEVTL